MADERELAWAAGFFDGEGHIRFHRGNSSWTMEVGQADIRPLERFLAAVGTGKIASRPKKMGKARNGGAYWSWELYGAENVQRVFALLYPYFSAPKREQGDAALARWRSRVDGRREGALKREAAYRENWTGAYVCPDCGHLFTRPNVLNRHRRTVH
jgi:hypothetical protein